MKYSSQDFQRFDQARSRPVEVLIAVSQVDASAAYGPELRPFRLVSEPMHFRARALGIPATRHHDDDLRVRSNKLLPTHPGRMLAGFAEQIHASGHLDQFWNPVAGGYEG